MTEINFTTEVNELESRQWERFHADFTSLVQSNSDYRERRDSTHFDAWTYLRKRGDQDVRFEIDRSQTSTEDSGTFNTFEIKVRYEGVTNIGKVLPLDDVRIPGGSSLGEYRVIVQEKVLDKTSHLDSVFLEIFTDGGVTSEGQKKARIRQRVSLFPMNEALKPFAAQIIDGVYESATIAYSGSRKRRRKIEN